MTVLGRPLIILNSAKMAVDMLEKKSSKYSDRPILPMGGELGTFSSMIYVSRAVCLLCIISRLEKYFSARSVRRTVQRIQEILPSANWQSTKHGPVSFNWRAWNPRLSAERIRQACRPCCSRSQVNLYLVLFSWALYLGQIHRQDSRGHHSSNFSWLWIAGGPWSFRRISR